MISIDKNKTEEIKNKGFALVENIVDAHDIPILKFHLQTAIDKDLPKFSNKDHPDAWMVHNLMMRGVPFAKLLENPLMHCYLSELLGGTCILYAYQSSSMPPKGTNYSRRIHVDCPRIIPGYITNIGIMIALDAYTEDNGATYFLPYSTQLTHAPSEAEFEAKAERLFPKPGDAIIFNARTWHRGGVNMTDQPRHAITLNVCRAYMRQRFDFPRLVSEDVVNLLGETGKRFLGFNVRMPTSLDEYYLPENDRLYKANQG